MAPVDPTTTNRFRMTYEGPFGKHTMLFHGGLEGTQTTLREAIAEIVAVMLPFQYDGTTWNLAEYSEAGSNLFFPDTDWVIQTGDSTVNPSATSAPSAFIQFGGRSPFDGTRVKYYLFETFALPQDDMRVQFAENAETAAIITAIEDAGSVLGTISGSSFTTYRYANLGQNDYLTHRARRS